MEELDDYYTGVASVESARARVTPQVEDCIQKIQTWAVPYFRETARELGVDWPGL